jgi:hypothetical protein
MSLKSSAGFGFSTAVFFLLVLAAAAGHGQTPAENATRTIQRGSEAEKALKMQEPSFQTREERLQAKPLDWNATIGKPTPRRLTPAERSALRGAKPETAEGGAPNPNADDEARKLHPDDWK